MPLFPPAPTGVTVPSTSNVLIGNGAGGISDSHMPLAVQSDSFGGMLSVLHYNNPNADTLGLQNDDSSGYSTAVFFTSAGVARGSIGVKADGSLNFIEVSNPTGVPSSFRIISTNGADATQNHDILLHRNTGDSEFYTTTCKTTPPLTLADNGQILFQHPSGIYGPIVTTTDANGIAAWRCLDAPGGTELAAFGVFRNDGGHPNAYIHYSGGILKFLGDSAETHLLADGELQVPKVTIGGGAAITKVLTATATLDFGSVASGAYTDLTIAVTGAAVGDTVIVTPPDTSAYLTSFSAFVSSADVVTVRFNNFLADASDPAGGSFRATVFKF